MLNGHRTTIYWSVALFASSPSVVFADDRTEPLPDIGTPFASPQVETPQSFGPSPTSRSFEQRNGVPFEAYDRSGRLKPELVALDGYETPPAPYVERTRAHRGMWLGGTFGLAGSWAASTATSLIAYSLSDFSLEVNLSGEPIPDPPRDETFLLGIIPVAGPFIEAGIHASENEFNLVDGLMLVLGGGQIASGAILIAGLFTDQEVWVLDTKQSDSPRINLHLSPTINGLSGSF
jgi:hypothetical protein